MAESVFVFTPIYRLEPETVKALLALDWNGPLALYLQRDNPYTDGRDNITHQYQQGRRVFLAGPYRWMMIIESDIIPPRDSITRLMELGADVAYGHYVFRASGVSNVYERYPGVSQNEGESLSLWPDKYAEAMRAGVVACSGGGLGCVLIRRRVLERLDFRHIAHEGGHCDTYFNRDAMRANMLQRADMRLICGHVDEDGRVLYPPGYAIPDGHH